MRRLRSVTRMRRTGSGKWKSIGASLPVAWRKCLAKPALDTDKFLRTIGIARTAQSIYQNLDAEHRDLLDAYAAGVNAYLNKRGGPLPPEFFLTRAPKPEPWTPADSIGWSLMMAWDLARYSYSRELRRMQLAQRFSVAEINDFYPPYPGDSPPATADYAELYRLLGLKAKPVTALKAPDFGSETAKESARTTGWYQASAPSAASRWWPTIRISA